MILDRELQRLGMDVFAVQEARFHSGDHDDTQTKRFIFSAKL